MNPANVSAIIITKGDLQRRDFDLMIASVHNCGQVRIVSPQGRYEYGLPDQKVYNRYATALELMEAHNRQQTLAGAPKTKFVVYVQDDDVCTRAEDIIAQYEPGVVTCNMPEDFRHGAYMPNHYGPEHELRGRSRYSALVGFGAVFDADLIWPAMYRYLERWPLADPIEHHPDNDDLFHIECDRVFTAFNRTKFIDVPMLRLDASRAADRISMQPDHLQRFNTIRARIEAVR